MIQSVHREPNELGGYSVSPYYYMIALNPRDWFFRHQLTIHDLDIKEIRHIEENLCKSNFRGRIKWEYVRPKQIIRYKFGLEYKERGNPSYVFTIRFSRASDATYFKLRHI